MGSFHAAKKKTGFGSAGPCGPLAVRLSFFLLLYLRFILGEKKNENDIETAVYQ